MRRLGVVAFDGVRVVLGHAFGKLLELLVEAAQGFILLNHGLIQRLGELLQVRQGGLDFHHAILIGHARG